MSETRHTPEEIDRWRARILGTALQKDLLTGLTANAEQAPMPRSDTVLDSMVVAVVSFLTGLGAGIALMLLKRLLHG